MKFLDKLYEYMSGLDTAGNFESSYFEIWYEDLKNKLTTKEKIFEDIKYRYQNNNPEVVKDFQTILLGEKA